MSAVFEGYGADFAKLAYNTPDYDKLMHLEQNVYQFSTAKNWQMIKELTLSLKDGDKIVPFKDFKNKAITILDEYNHRHLKTEYQAAIAGAQMASKWVDAENSLRIARENGTPEPLLQYRTMEDQRVRESHAALNRITRPVADSFWSKYYPPNGWNCRCTTVRTFRHEKTSDIDTALAAAAVEPQKGFNVNLAKEGFVFPKDSPYYIGLPQNQMNAHLTIQRKTMIDYAKNNLIGKTFASPIGDINISMVGIKKLLNQPHKYIYEKNNALYKLPEILSTAKLIGSSKDAKNKVDKLYYLKVQISGNKTSYIVIKEVTAGQKFLYTLQDNNRDEKTKSD